MDASAANKILEQHWDGKLPVDPVRIAEKMGIRVVKYDFDDDTICDTGLEGDAATIRIARYVTENEPVRARFAIAHALGHALLHKEDLKQLETSQASRSLHRPR